MTAPATSNWSFKRPVGTESVWQSPGRTGQQLTVKHISLSLSTRHYLFGSRCQLAALENRKSRADEPATSLLQIE